MSSPGGWWRKWWLRHGRQTIQQSGQQQGDNPGTRRCNVLPNPIINLKKVNPENESAETLLSTYADVDWRRYEASGSMFQENG